MNQPDPAAPGFSEQSLRQAIINTWGPAGAHIDVYDHLLAALATAEGRAEHWEDHAAALALLCNERDAAAEAVVEAAEPISKWLGKGIDYENNAKKLFDALANYHKATGPQAKPSERPGWRPWIDEFPAGGATGEGS